MTADHPGLLTAEDLLAHYAPARCSPVEVAAGRHRAHRPAQPRANAFAVLNPRALDAAGESEARWRAGRPLGMLDGVPGTVKDLVDLAGFPTRRGSRLTDAAPVADDAPMVLGLKAAGAVILGKTTTTEFGWKSPGDCPLHGITRNPWNPAHTPGGSSSGAGAAAAAGFGPLHIGTDAGGSIRIPAAWCGLVGLKPTYGRVPQWPPGAFADVACAGPMTRTVRDAALMLSAMARFDSARSVLPAGRSARLARRHRGRRGGLARRRAAPPRLRGAGRCRRHRRGGARRAAAGRRRRRGRGSRRRRCPTRSVVFARVWGAALARLVRSFPEDRRALLDPGLLEVARHSAA